MSLTKQIAQQIRAVYFGGNWTDSTLKGHLSDLSWQQATAKIEGFNTIAVLVFHMNYFVEAVIKVLEGGPLDAHDKYSFDLPPIQSQEDWEKLLETTWANAETFASLAEQLPDSKLPDTFVLEKYGTYHRNLHGVVEHTHYHLGQIVWLKKMLAAQAANS